MSEALQKSLEVQPYNPEDILNLGFSFITTQNYEKAVIELQKV